MNPNPSSVPVVTPRTVAVAGLQLTPYGKFPATMEFYEYRTLLVMGYDTPITQEERQKMTALSPAADVFSDESGKLHSFFGTLDGFLVPVRPECYGQITAFPAVNPTNLEHLRGVVFKAETAGGKYGIHVYVDEASGVMKEKWGHTISIQGNEYTQGRSVGSFGLETVGKQRDDLIRTVVNARYMSKINYLASVDKLGVMAEAGRHTAALPVGRVVSNLDSMRAHLAGLPLPPRVGPSDHLPSLLFEAQSPDGEHVIQITSKQVPHPQHPETEGMLVNEYETKHYENGKCVGHGSNVDLKKSLAVDLMLETKHMLGWEFHVVRDNAGVLAAMQAVEPEYVAEHKADIRLARMEREGALTVPGFQVEGLKGIVFRAEAYNGGKAFDVIADADFMQIRVREQGVAVDAIRLWGVEDAREKLVSYLLADAEKGVQYAIKGDSFGVAAEIARYQDPNTAELVQPRRAAVVTQFLAHSLDGKTVLQATEHDPKDTRPHQSPHVISNFGEWVDGTQDHDACLFSEEENSKYPPRMPTPVRLLLESKHKRGVELVVVTDSLGIQAAAKEQEAAFVREHGSKLPGFSVDAYLTTEKSEGEEASMQM